VRSILEEPIPFHSFKSDPSIMILTTGVYRMSRKP
jgi:hypothetical protein